MRLNGLVACKRGAAVSAQRTKMVRRRAAALRWCEPGRGFPAAKTCTHGCYAEQGSMRTDLEVPGEVSGVHDGQHRKGAKWPLRRAREENVVHKKEGKGQGGFAHHAEATKAGTQTMRKC
jgi:hypothetical protein